MIRKDIQALRAIAVIAVLVYHFWPTRLTGGYVGVDVFFVISGFLITSHLLRKPPVSWRLLADFWARRIKRLIPAATVVLFATVIASLLWLPETMIGRVLREVVASAVYGQNWMLAAAATDYLAATEAPSPVQHYWSLSIEEQFYIVWPVIIGGMFLLGRKLLTVHKLLALGMAVIFFGSLAYSIYLTSANPAAAYFVTPVRVWELALGGVVALFAIKYTISSKLAVTMAWLGLAMIAAAILLFTSETPFPGYTALLPTIGTALVIIAATDNMKWSPRRLLGLKPVQFIGDISYSIYLWHWPILIIAPFAFGVSNMPVSLSVSLIVNVIILAYFTKVYIEDPVRRSKRLVGTNPRTYVYGIASIALVIGLTFAVSGHPKVQALQRTEDLKKALDTDPCVGSGVMRDRACAGKYEGQLLATPSFAKTDLNVLYKGGCFSNAPAFKKDLICQYGQVDSDIKIALLGNSHAGSWQPALERIASDNSWNLETYLVSSCYTIDRPLVIPGEGASENCQEWNRWAIDQIIQKKYDTVIMSSHSVYRPLVGVDAANMHAERIKGYTNTIEKFVEKGIRVFVIRDSPQGGYDKNAPDCLAASGGDISECTADRKTTLVPDPLYDAALKFSHRDVNTLDLTDRFCDDTTCYPAAGGVVIYFDSNHLTKSYAQTLTPDISPALTKFINGN